MDQKCTVGGREFDCTNVVLVREADKARRTLTLWLSPEIKCQGLVEAIEEEEGVEKLRLRLVGYGHGDKAEWGKGLEKGIPWTDNKQRSSCAQWDFLALVETRSEHS